MADVFISYKSDDRTDVQRLVVGLRAHDLAVWWDQDIPPGAPWEATIERELKDAVATIVVWSPRSVASENVKAEARWARREGRLVQVFVAHCVPPLFFGESQGVNLQNWGGDLSDHRFQAVVTALRAIVAGKAPPEGVGYSPARRRWRWRVAVGGLAASVVALVLAVTVGRPPAPPTPTLDPAAAAARARQKLLQSIEGSWDRQGGTCATPVSIRTATDPKGITTITVSGPRDFKSAGQVITTVDGDVLTRAIDAVHGGAGQAWEYQPNGALMTVVDGRGVHTPLVRCPA